METDVIIHQDYMSNSAEVYFRQREGGKTFIIGYDGELLLRQEVDENSFDKKYKPLLKLPSHMLDLVMKTFSEELSKKGYRTKNENQLEGKLAATETHLSDMREMSKLMLTKLVGAGGVV